jgi:hypothetical protein
MCRIAHHCIGFVLQSGMNLCPAHDGQGTSTEKSWLLVCMAAAAANKRQLQ